MTSGLVYDLKTTKREDTNTIDTIDTKLYKLNALKTKLRNCLTQTFGDDIEESIPTGINNKDGHIFFCLIISRTFPDKEAHKDIIRNYIMELKIIKSKSMESYQQDMSRHLKQYENIKGIEWKKITNTIIKQYRKINEPAFQTGLNTNIPMGPTEHKYH
jgi:hypothetical protein